MRQIVLDTETTGLETSEGHRIIEIGCVEIVDRRCTGRVLHQYINPERDIDEGAAEVHGIRTEDLLDKPVFAAVVDEFMAFVEGAELVIHNAPFDVGFLNHELKLLDASPAPIEQHCGILDTLVMARQRHPGQRVSLDALCRRYGVDNSSRELHGALLDARLLAEVYLAMTGGQVGLSLDGEQSDGQAKVEEIRRLSAERAPLPVIRASTAEIEAHDAKLASIDKASEEGALWRH
ncbi:MAG: DNA polymerase III subunit epsilon [Alcanivoracaceae bacterium]|nr:DNA polymerase III subunit epsilon [Alcanivoracaceae bacterium]